VYFIIIDQKVLKGKLKITLTLKGNDIKTMKAIRVNNIPLHITSCCRSDEERKLSIPVSDLEKYGLIEDRHGISEYQLTKL